MSAKTSFTSEVLPIDLVGGEYAIPSEIEREQAAWLQALTKLRRVRSDDLSRARDQYRGGAGALSDQYFPQPHGVGNSDWAQFKRLMTHVNLVKPSVRCFRSAVYGGDVVRRCVRNPYRGVVKPWLESVEYSEAVSAWIEAAILYGTAVAVPRYDDDTGELSVWLPDPVCTYLFADPLDVSRIVGLAEVKPDMIRYMATWGQGHMIRKGGSVHRPQSFKTLPVAVAYGVDQRQYGEVYGLSLVQDAVDWTIRCTDVAFNVAVLQKQQTRSILVLIGDESTADGTSGDGWGPSKALRMMGGSPSGDAKFITPDAKIRETIDIIKQFVGLLATASSIPQDVLDATLTQSVSSAEAARIRAIPLVQQSRWLVPVWRRNEQALITAATAVIESEKTGGLVDVAAVRKRVVTDIQLSPAVIPTSDNERIQNLIAAVTAGLMLPEDAIRALNPAKPEQEIAEMASALRDRMDAAKASPSAVADAVTKQAAGIDSGENHTTGEIT